MPTLRRIANQFRKQLLEEYRNGLHILTCFRMYIGFLIVYANPKHDKKPYGQFDPFQIKDMEMAIHNDKIDTTKEILETMWLYTRRGGKTKNMTVVATFFAILGYLVMWRSAYTDQLNMAKYWFLKNPFINRIVMGQQDNRIEVLNSPSINFDVIAPGKTQSRGADVIILDEECLIALDSRKYDIYEKLRPSLFDSTFKHFLHGSTNELNTVSEQTWFHLKDLEIIKDTILTAEHPWQDCHWLSPEMIEDERRLHSDDPYYVDMQYELKWTVPGGKVFNNLIVPGDARFPDYPEGFLDSIEPTHGGVDFNGDINLHYLDLIAYDDTHVYMIDEIQFSDLNELFSDKYRRISLELEDGGYNLQFTEKTREMGLRCIYNMNWNGVSGDDKKMIRVQELRNRYIVIDPARCPKTYQNLKNCAFNRFKLRTQIVKTKDQHGLDALLHALHESYSGIYIPQRRQARKGLFDKIMNRPEV